MQILKEDLKKQIKYMLKEEAETEAQYCSIHKFKFYCLKNLIQIKHRFKQVIKMSHYSILWRIFNVIEWYILN